MPGTDGAVLVNPGITTPIDVVQQTSGYGTVQRQRIQTVGQDEYVTTTASAAALAAGLVTLISARAASGVVRRGYRLQWTGDVNLTVYFGTNVGSGGLGSLNDCTLVLPPGNVDAIVLEISPEGLLQTQGLAHSYVSNGLRSLLQMPAQTLTVSAQATSATVGTLTIDYTGQWGGAPGSGMVERVELPTGDRLTYIAATTNLTWTVGVDNTYQFGSGLNAQEARHIVIQNNSTVTISIGFDAAVASAAACAFQLAPNQTFMADLRVTTLHFWGVAALTVNSGSIGSSVVVMGWR